MRWRSATKKAIQAEIDYAAEFGPRALLQYYGNIDQMNHSLDLAEGLEGEKRQEEITRTIHKACSLIPIRELRNFVSAARPNELEHRIITKKNNKLRP